MLARCKDLTRDTLTDWAFVKDAAFVLQLVLHAVCSCMSQLCVSHVEQEYNGTRDIFLCGAKFCFVDRARTKNHAEDQKWLRRRVPRDEVKHRGV